MTASRSSPVSVPEVRGRPAPGGARTRRISPSQAAIVCGASRATAYRVLRAIARVAGRRCATVLRSPDRTPLGLATRPSSRSSSYVRRRPGAPSGCIRCSAGRRRSSASSSANWPTPTSGTHAPPAPAHYPATSAGTTPTEPTAPSATHPSPASHRQRGPTPRASGMKPDARPSSSVTDTGACRAASACEHMLTLYSRDAHNLTIQGWLVGG